MTSNVSGDALGGDGLSVPDVKKPSVLKFEQGLPVSWTLRLNASVNTVNIIRGMVDMLSQPTNKPSSTRRTHEIRVGISALEQKG